MSRYASGRRPIIANANYNIDYEAIPSSARNFRIKSISSYIFSNIWSGKKNSIVQDELISYAGSHKVDFSQTQTEKQRNRLKSKTLDARISATKELYHSPRDFVPSSRGGSSSRNHFSPPNRFSSSSSTTKIEDDTVIEELTVLPRKKKIDTTVADRGPSSKPLCCDKCDGKHETDACPYFRKSRENHPDAKRGAKDKLGGTSLLPGSFITNARVARQPGDGSCLFHSMSYGLKQGNASRLRAEICSFIQKNPNLNISDTPLKDWVRWDSGYSNVKDYARHMSYSAWGGGIEMACVSQMKECNVHVYERSCGGFKRISAFDCPRQPQTKPTVRVLYGGGVHYDALVTS